MKVLILVVGLAAFFELLWTSHPALRHQRVHFRAMVALFWGLTTLIWAGSAWGVLPAGLYFNGVPRFASDAVTYQAQARYVAEGLRGGAIGPLLDLQIFNYSRLTGLIFYLFDDSRLAASLFNVVFYMASVLSVFLLGRRLFDDRAGLWAAWMAACWPTFLLHETQTLRWVSTTAGLHLVVLATAMITGSSRLYRPLLCGLAGFAILLADQPQLARMSYLAVFAQVAILLVAAARVRAWPIRAMRLAAFAAVMFVAYDVAWVRSANLPAPEASDSAIPRAAVADEGMPGQPSGERKPALTPEDVSLEPTNRYLDRLIAPILSTRNGYLLQNDELRRDGISVGTTLFGSPLRNAREFFANIPTALSSAVLVPTPSSLLRSRGGASRVGSYAVVEVLLYYALLATMCLGLKRALSRGGESMLISGYVLLFTGMVYIVIGTVTMNGGTLHRLRLPFVVLHMVYAAPVLAAWVPALARRVLEARR